VVRASNSLTRGIVAHFSGLINTKMNDPGNFDYLVIPMPPTPNGTMHIGHIAGPYLRADTLTRALRRDGHRVLLISGTDAYENWVLLEAGRRNESPQVTCKRNFGLIKHDFDNLSIIFDLWFDPTVPEHAARYRNLHEQILRKLMAVGRADLVQEPIPVSTTTGDYVIGAWITGLCPVCGERVAGNSCVACGAGFQPTEIINPRSRYDGDELIWSTKASWFTTAEDINKIGDVLKDTTLQDEFMDIVHDHLRRVGATVRLSQPGGWGIKSSLVEPDCVLTNTFYEFALYCGELAGRFAGKDNLFSSSCESHIVTLFGKDNCAIGLVAPAIIKSNLPNIRLFNTILVNHLLHFEGSKCSTSRKHGIWVSELVDNTDICADELRYALSQLPLEARSFDLKITQIVENINEMRQWHRSRLIPIISHQAQSLTAAYDRHLEQEMMSAVAYQGECLSPRCFDLPRATEVMRSWLFRSEVSEFTPPRCRVWMEGVALLSWPIMPGLGNAIWRFLGFDGIPVTKHVVDRTAPRSSTQIAPKSLINLETILPFVHLGGKT